MLGFRSRVQHARITLWTLSFCHGSHTAGAFPTQSTSSLLWQKFWRSGCILDAILKGPETGSWSVYQSWLAEVYIVCTGKHWYSQVQIPALSSSTCHLRWLKLPPIERGHFSFGRLSVRSDPLSLPGLRRTHRLWRYWFECFPVGYLTYSYLNSENIYGLIWDKI